MNSEIRDPRNVLSRAQAGRLSALSQVGATPRRAGGLLPGGARGLPDAKEWKSPSEDLQGLHLLVIDEDAVVRTSCAEIGRHMGFQVIEAVNLAAAQTVIRQQKVDVVLLDLKSSGVGTGRGTLRFSLLEEVKTLHPETSVVVMTVTGTVANAVEAMRLGAADYLTKPFAVEELVTRLERASQRTQVNLESRLLRDRLRRQRGGGPLIGNSPERWRSCTGLCRRWRMRRIRC